MIIVQDTYTCPDGWHISDIGDEVQIVRCLILFLTNQNDYIIFKKVECILLSGKDERVTKADAAVICEFHEGWLVDMDEGRGEGYGLNEEVISI